MQHKANQVCKYPILLHTLANFIQAQAGAREAKQDFEKEIKK